MLGVNKSNSPLIEIDYAKEMLEAVRRKYANQPSEADVQTSTRSEQIKKEYRAVWK